MYYEYINTKNGFLGKRIMESTSSKFFDTHKLEIIKLLVKETSYVDICNILNDKYGNAEDKKINTSNFRKWRKQNKIDELIENFNSSRVDPENVYVPIKSLSDEQKEYILNIEPETDFDNYCGCKYHIDLLKEAVECEPSSHILANDKTDSMSEDKQIKETFRIETYDKPTSNELTLLKQLHSDVEEIKRQLIIKEEALIPTYAWLLFAFLAGLIIG